MDFAFKTPPSSHVDYQIFHSQGTGWQSWSRPSGASMIFILAVGGGGGGAGGNSAGGLGGLGDGGGSGAIARLLIGARSIPDCLFVQAGAGGTSGFSTPPTHTNGGDGARSFVSVAPANGAPALANIVLTSGTTAAQGGRTNNAGSAGETIATAAGAPLAMGGVWVAVAGAAGAHSDGSLSVTALANSIVCGGAAGPTEVANAAGGDITGAGLLPTLAGGSAGPTAGQGKHGFVRWFPMMFTGGSAGGACVGGGGGGAGGNGGNGAYGCGGGGAGGSDTDANAATIVGGRGGNGFVIIASW